MTTFDCVASTLVAARQQYKLDGNYSLNSSRMHHHAAVSTSHEPGKWSAAIGLGIFSSGSSTPSMAVAHSSRRVRSAQSKAIALLVVLAVASTTLLAPASAHAASVSGSSSQAAGRANGAADDSSTNAAAGGSSSSQATSELNKLLLDIVSGLKQHSQQFAQLQLDYGSSADDGATAAMLQQLARDSSGCSSCHSASMRGGGQGGDGDQMNHEFEAPWHLPAATPADYEVSLTVSDLTDTDLPSRVQRQLKQYHGEISGLSAGSDQQDPLQHSDSHYWQRQAHYRDPEAEHHYWQGQAHSRDQHAGPSGSAGSASNTLSPFEPFMSALVASNPQGLWHETLLQLCTGGWGLGVAWMVMSHIL